jgi:hypothetical protein
VIESDARRQLGRPDGEGALSWRPLLTGAAAAPAWSALTAIAESLSARSAGERDPSLAGGSGGLSLLYAWLALSESAAAGQTAGVAEEKAWRFLDAAIEGLSDVDAHPSLWGGITGIAWLTTMVDSALDPDGEDRLGEIDEALPRLVTSAGSWPAPHDLVVALTGVGVLATERYPREAAVVALREIVARLDASASADDAGRYWRTPPAGIRLPSATSRYPHGVIDLGVAHGMSGAIAMLGRICALGGEFASARPLVDDAVRWLVAHAIDTERGPTFPAWLVPGEPPSPARSAWCYGDPGIAAALLVAARGTSQVAWEQEARALAIRAACRPEEDSGVVDASLCHGTAGLMHLFNRMYQATGEPCLRDAALRWLDRTLATCRTAQAEGDSWVEGADDFLRAPWTGVDIVNGAAGVALALLAAVSPIEPGWDRMFLMSPMPPSSAGPREASTP